MDPVFANHVPLKAQFYQNFNYNKLRRIKLMLFGEIMNKYKQFNKLTYDDQINIVKKIERGCYHISIDKANSGEYNIHTSWSNTKFINLYHGICYKVASNLDYESSVGSKYLAHRVLNNHVAPIDLAKMSSKLMCPDKYVDIDKKLDKMSNIETTVKTTELYQCYKCKKTQCTIQTIINRGLDEGDSIRVMCQFCGNFWCC